MLIRKALRLALLPVSAGALLGVSTGALAAGSWDAGSFTLTYGGYIKADVLYSDYSDGNPAGNSIGRDWYVPSTTPVGGDDDDGVLDLTPWTELVDLIALVEEKKKSLIVVTHDTKLARLGDRTLELADGRLVA